MADTEIPEGLAEIGRNLADADEIVVGKWRSPITRLVTYLSSKFAAGTGLAKTGETFSIAAGGVGTTQLADNGVSNLKLRDSAATSVIGRSAGSSGDPADIAATTNDRVLARTVGGILDWVQVTSAMLASSIVTPAKLAAWPAASLHRATAQSIGSGSLTIVQLSAKTFVETGGIDAPVADNVTNFRITIVRAGLYRVSARVSITPSASTGVFAGSVCLNGSEAAQAGVSAVSGTPTTLHITELMSLAVNDYLDLRIYHTVGSSQNTGTGTHLRPILQAEYVGPTA